jgi:hypothetical protein
MAYHLPPPLNLHSVSDLQSPKRPVKTCPSETLIDLDAKVEFASIHAGCCGK